MTQLHRLIAFVLLLAASAPAWAVDVYGKRFDPPRAYLTQASINKNAIFALRGQDNFVRFYVPPFDAADRINPQGWALTVTLPKAARVLDDPKHDWQVRETDDAVIATIELDPAIVANRCLRNTWGIDEIIWIRVDELADNPRKISLTLSQDDRVTFEDRGELRIFDELTAPPHIDPDRFRLWLHYGPYYRHGHWDELAAYLRKAGINAIQIMAWNMDMIRAMDERDFYIIAQRGGSYHDVYYDMEQVLELGPSWFAQHDGGQMIETMPYADAVLWDFEPSPGNIATDEQTLARFRAHAGIPADQSLDESIIRVRYHRQWIDFRQDEYAAIARSWAKWSHSLKPDIETILTEGRCNIFDPLSQVDYRKIGAENVSVFDPMNFAGHNAVLGMLKWREAMPEADFAGCQNVAMSRDAPVFVSAHTIMLQTLTAALIGNVGTAVYPGNAMDAENFKAWNRVMTYLGEHQDFIWDGEQDPDNLILNLLPKEDADITLGDGRTIRHVYPDWSEQAITHVAHREQGDAYLVTIANWNGGEPCYATIQLLGTNGAWSVVDDESRRVLTLDGKRAIDAAQLTRGIHVHVPPTDYRGFRIVRADAAPRDYEPLAVEAVARDAQAYASSGDAGAGATGNGKIRIDYDDVNRDGQIEQVVTTPVQKLWITQAGHVLRWESRDHALQGKEHGLMRDMLYLPVTERSNSAVDSAMQLEGRRVRDDGIELIYTRDVSLDSLGGLVSLKLTRSIDISADKPQVNVDVTIKNTSLSMSVLQIPLSYRVHNYLTYDQRNDQTVWFDDGQTVHRHGLARNKTIPAQGLSERETDLLFHNYEQLGPYRIEAFGEHYADDDLLWQVTPEDSEALLQVLRWVDGRTLGGTLEWIYRPVDLPRGQTWSTSYAMNLTPNVAAPSAGAVRGSRPKAARSSADDGLLMHLDFNDSVGDAQVEGEAVFEDTPTGRGLRVTDGTTLTFEPQGKIDLQRGRLLIRYKPLYDGADGQTHEWLTIYPVRGYVYVAKLADGRILMNMFDREDEQHYPWTIGRDMKAGEWHELMVTWDAQAGRMMLYLDGEKRAEYMGKPWIMGELDNAHPRCRMTIPASAACVIDELRIWETR